MSGGVMNVAYVMNAPPDSEDAPVRGRHRWATCAAGRSDITVADAAIAVKEAEP